MQPDKCQLYCAKERMSNYYYFTALLYDCKLFISSLTFNKDKIDINLLSSKLNDPSLGDRKLNSKLMKFVGRLKGIP